MNDSLLQRIYDATNNGLDIILYYYPQAHGCDKKGKYFKIRGDEQNPSACMKEIKGVWRVTDFGDEQTAMAPIEICMREERLDFREALFRLADRYDVGNVISKEVNKAKIEQRDAIIYNPMRFCRQDWSWLRCMIVCLWRVLRSDIVYVMYDYGGSRGSSMERKLALKLGKEVVYVAC